MINQYFLNNNHEKKYISHISVGSSKFLQLLSKEAKELADIYLLVDEFDDLVGMHRLPLFHKGDPNDDSKSGVDTHMVDVLDLIARCKFVSGFCSEVE